MAVIIIKPEQDWAGELRSLKRLTEPLTIKTCGINVRFTPSGIILYEGSRIVHNGMCNQSREHALIGIADINNVLPFKHREIVPRPIEYIDDPKCADVNLYDFGIRNDSQLARFIRMQRDKLCAYLRIIYPNSVEPIVLLGNDYYVSVLPLHPRALEHPKIRGRKRLRMTQFVITFLARTKNLTEHLARAIAEMTMETGPIDLSIN